MKPHHLAEAMGRIYAHLFAKPCFYKMNLHLFHLALRGMGVLNCSPSTSGENYTIRKILPSLIDEKSPVFFDVGANCGAYSRMLSDRFPSAIIHAFEPHPKTFSTLSPNVPENVTCHNLAVGDQQGSFSLFDRNDRDGSPHASLHKDVITQLHKQSYVEHKVQATTLDSFCETKNIPRIDFLKIDTEGHEYAVLQGAKNLIASGRISVIQFEFGAPHLSSHIFLDDIRKLLKEYSLFRILPKKLLLLTGEPIEKELFAFQNILAIPTAK